MRPTRRGYVALAVVAAALLFAWGSGPRSLNAVAAPVLVAVVAGGVQVYRAGEPRIERTDPRPGFPGETRSVELTVDGGGVGRVRDRLDDALDGTATFERSLPATVEYEVRYERRGVHSLGPTIVGVRDVLGLVERTYEVREPTTVVVYPRVYSVGDPSSVLQTRGPERHERTEFQHVREYVPGDSLRDVHWKSSAKGDDLLVAEFTSPADDAGVSIAASAAPGFVDEMAAAAATLFVAATRSGVAAELTVPGGSVPLGHGDTHEQRALELLARTGSGDVADEEWGGADVRVRADGSGTRVAVDGRVRSLEELTATRDNPLLTEVVA